MNVVTVSASSQDTTSQGSVTFKPRATSRLDGQTRRVAGYATLDGGRVLSDLGFQAADYSPSLDLDPDLTVVAAIKYLQENYAVIVLSTDQGCFTGAIRQIIKSGSRTRVDFELKERIDDGDN